MPSIGTILPMMFSEGFHKRGVPIEALVKVMCGNPARVFGLYPTRGVLAEGSGGDLAIVDLKAERKVRGGRSAPQSRLTPYEGWAFKDWPTTTIVRGRVVYADGAISGRGGDGRFVPMRGIEWS